MSSGVPQSTRSMETPTVSVILPTCNRLKYLRPAVDSVFAQTLQDWELIIADDGSGAETMAYLSTLAGVPRVRLLRLAQTRNPSAVRNAALREARGRYVAFLDSDDIWLPTKLEVQVGALRNAGSRRWNYTAVRRIGPDGEIMAGEAARTWIPYEGLIFEQLLTLEAAVATPTVVAERRLVEEAGAFDERQLYFEEYDLWFRLNRLSEVGVIAEPLVLVRSHHEHYTADRVRVYEARSRLLDKISDAANTVRLSSALRAERAKNAISLARAYARQARRTQALQTLWCGRDHIWQARRWSLQPAGAALADALAPTWLRALARYCRRRSRALVFGRA
jgi:glycosyltransferase involved in cell wall biosynthesis